MDFNAFSFLFLLRQKMLSAAPFRICVNGTSYGYTYTIYMRCIDSTSILFRITNFEFVHFIWAIWATHAITQIFCIIWSTCAISNTLNSIHHNICIDEHHLTDISCMFGVFDSFIQLVPIKGFGTTRMFDFFYKTKPIPQCTFYKSKLNESPVNCPVSNFFCCFSF